jgi:CxxC motif-containing protein
MSDKRLICLSCPIGCELTVHIEDGEVLTVEGNRCARGDAYGRQEAVRPMRILPTSVRVTGGTRKLLSVKTDRPIPLELIPAAMRRIKGLSVEAPVQIHDVVLDDLLGTGAKLVATRNVSATRD